MGVSLNGMAESLHIFRKSVLLLLPVLLLSFSVKLQQNRCRGNAIAHTGADVAYCFLYKTKFYMAFSVMLHLSYLLGPVVLLTNSIYLTWNQDTQARFADAIATQSCFQWGSGNRCLWRLRKSFKNNPYLIYFLNVHGLKVTMNSKSTILIFSRNI